ncbi:FMN-binding negative transcriptional regulator [Niabella soli]|uniref:Transcriptional regulator n=1 Tax=Niabella soli DSM 19437 TaxID=929713 RepID=W0F0N1_9BACT|nr:FMN-binding negative transcriptional regulator [Niabella soli]AHF15383.1 transcriptional regulator [Niabella soli DSM 19437]
MYIPAFNKMTDPDAIISFIKRFSFGTIITTEATGRPVATHLPFLIEKTATGLFLLSHFAKANPQWQQIAANKNILVIFSEPHAYISPTHYEQALSVPTWNYITVHLYGQGEVITDPQQVTELLDRTVENYEPAYKPTHDALPKDFIQKMSKGIVAFKIQVTDIQAKEKLSQNKTKREQEKIIRTLSASPLTTEQDIAKYMRERL